MSQSPIDDFSAKATLSYQQGWRALNRLLHEDRSFSGHERNCAFLNTGGDSASFADVSSATGFDFADDGRGLATADWDFDGDLDVWTTNRTAPRVRFLKNNTQPTADQFVAFKLRGDGISTNRDAIGARIELHLTGSPHPVRIRTLHGGEGFLSQSSNWIHFGIGKAESIEKLVVRWPGGKPQELTALEFGNFYLVKQGGSKATIFSPPADRLPIATAAQQPLPIDERTRTIVPPGLILPELSTVNADGSEKSYAPVAGRPTIINVWASWCAPCIAELTDWASQSQQLKSAGFDVIALSTDSINTNPIAAQKAVATALAKTGFTFPSAQLSESGFRALDHLQRAVLDRWKPLPVPTTFLVEPSGDVLAIYKGTVTVPQLLADLELASASPARRRVAGLPFPGKWVQDENIRADPQRVASSMLDHDDTEAAIRYLDRAAKLISQKETSPATARKLGDLLYMSGVLKSISPTRQSEAIDTLMRARKFVPGDLRLRKELAKQLHAAGRGKEAAAEMIVAIDINPSDGQLVGDLAELYRQLGDHSAAKQVMQKLVDKNPKNAAARYFLAEALLKLDEPAAAIAQYKQVLRDTPRLLDAANNLAWILSTHPDESIRSAEEAVVLAKRLCSATQEQQPQFLNTLAVALANTGQFPGAIEAAKKAIALYPEDDKKNTAPIRARIILFEAGKPFRE